MIKKVYIIDEAEFKKLRFDIIESIVSEAKKNYGCKFISHDTGEELEDMAVKGLLIFAIDMVWPK